MSAPGASHLLEAIFVGLAIGAVAAIPAHLLLSARNLRWTWALIPTAERARARKRDRERHTKRKAML